MHSAHFRKKYSYYILKYFLNFLFLVFYLFIDCFFVSAENHINLSPYLSYVSGALAGCAATVGSYPFDLLRTILASQGEPKVSILSLKFTLNLCNVN